jgi:hypothetical protein
MTAARRILSLSASAFVDRQSRIDREADARDQEREERKRLVRDGVIAGSERADRKERSARLNAMIKEGRNFVR